MSNVTYLDLLARYGVPGAHPGGLQLTKVLLRSEKLTPDMDLLDVGCGTGQTSAYIAQYFPPKVVAVDISPQMVKNAKETFAKNNLDIPIYCADAMTLPFRENSFDIILSESVLTFTKIHRTLHEFIRILKPAGVLLAIEVTASRQLADNELRDFQKTIGINYLPTRDQWNDAFYEAGFSQVRVLFHRKNYWVETISINKGHEFTGYINLMARYRHILGFGVYRCQL